MLNSLKYLIVILFTILLTNLGIYANDATLNKKGKSYEAYKFGIYLSGSYHKTIGDAKKYWEPYFTTGLHVDLPLYIPKFLVHFSVEAGQVDNKNKTVNDIKVLHSSVSLSYFYPLYKNHILIRPFFGVSNMIINFLKIEKITEINNISENEFGFITGLEPSLRIKRFQISLPFSINWIFSSPDMFNTLNLSLVAGIIF